ncbi:L-methionine/branched-chain amino acid transporter [Ferrimonas balearica]|uniref:L-methionine/branched-chain amino acid transporter n=1 Tax=Ferrimonas balearica TaxID=44012 RepID=UPI001C59519C|nr:L-methionine/branched-chain amino acid transporter [Ferrimonas balearica]MBW3139753.1 L-methionine/branched-chain amino acid transporter [Ferrimonas balearica]MBY6107141.1 L-methionine/branched-chain amino acid transporter [Ferrimonas balearica]
MTTLNPTITRWQGIGLLATSLLGTSVFILPQVTVAMAGTGALWAWALLILAMVPITLVFAQLGRRFPSAGGPAFFVEKAFGARAGVSVGLVFLFAAPVGLPAAMMMTFEFVHGLVPLTREATLLAQFGVLAAMVTLNLRGVQMSGRLQFGLTLVILGLMLALAVSLFGVEDVARETLSGPVSLSPVLAAAGVAIWSYLGIEAMSHLSAEFKSPERDFVPAMLWATLVVGLIYVLGTAMVLLVSGDSRLAMVDLFDQVMGSGGAWVIGVLGILAGVATMNTYLNAMSRLIWSLAQQRQLPRSLGQLNAHQVPQRALLSLAVVLALSLLCAYLGELDFDVLLPWVNGLFVVIYLLCMAAGYRLLSRRYRVLALIGAGFTALLGFALGTSLLYGIGSLLLVQVWVLWRRRRNRSGTLSAG